MALVQMHTPGRDGSQPGVTAAAAPASGTTPRWQVVVISFAAIIAVWLLSIAINATFRPAALVIPAGIGLFAMLYAVTQGLERLLEPVSAFFFSTKQCAENRNGFLATAVTCRRPVTASFRPGSASWPRPQEQPGNCGGRRPQGSSRLPLGICGVTSPPKA
jgi:hypothetical protein